MLKTNSIQIITAPSILGLKPSGVEKLPAALKDAGLLPSAYETPGNCIAVPTLNDQYSAERDTGTLLLNGPQIAQFALRVSDTLTSLLHAGSFLLVLGGDCSILIGPMLSLKQSGRYGLVFIDAHADFYQPTASTTGEVADMDLAIVSGRGPELLTDINGLGPYIQDSDIVHIGQRDMEETEKYGSQDIRNTSIRRFDIDFIRHKGMVAALEQTTTHIESSPMRGFWIHFDADALSDDMMPAVDYRLPGGLTLEEATLAIRTLAGHPKALGMTVTIYNPALDAPGKAGKRLVSCLNNGLG